MNYVFVCVYKIDLKPTENQTMSHFIITFLLRRYRFMKLPLKL